MDERTERLVAERHRLLARLGTLDVDWYPSDANFVLFRPRSRPSIGVWKALVESSVLVRDVSGYEGLDGYLRVTVGTPAENDAFFDALVAALA
jgi:histidinol-phosphate aminotransferase